MGRIDVRAFENGKLIGSAVAAMWAAFLNGRWTHERPSQPGKYLIANRVGRVVGEVFVFHDAELGGLAVRIRDSALCTIKELDEPGIWWWSKPMPYLMPLAVPGAVGHRPAGRKTPEPSEPPKMSSVEREYKAARRRKLAAQIGLHEMPTTKGVN